MAKQTSLLPEVSHSWAESSPDNLYRFKLARLWNERRPITLFIMLNPSTADAHNDDATIRNCKARSRYLGHGGFWVVNLFAFRATTPMKMMTARDPIGKENDRHILEAMKKYDCIIAAWGDNGDFLGRDQHIKALADRTGRRLWALRSTKKGQPGHPLYVPIETKPFVWYDPGELK